MNLSNRLAKFADALIQTGERMQAARGASQEFSQKAARSMGDAYTPSRAARNMSGGYGKSAYGASSAGDISMWSRAYTGGDAEALARAMAAEARGLLKKNPKAVEGVAYIIAQEAKKSGKTVEEVVKYKYPNGGHYLQSYGEGSKGINGKYYDEHKMPTSQIENYGQLYKIASDAIAGKDPTGIRPNHFYDTSIAPPSWAKGQGVKKTQIGNMVFVHNPLDANTKLRGR